MCSKVNITILILLVAANSVIGQADCRSILGAHLKPIKQSSFSWAIEGTGSGGILSDREVANWSLYSALDYSKNNHTVYFEGAYKDWYNSASNPDGNDTQSGLSGFNRPEQNHWRMRELYYNFDNTDFKIKAGIQTLQTAEYFLFDERMLGVSTNKTYNKIEFSGYLGTVSQQMARFQNVCGTRHIYNLFHRSQYNFVADSLFDTNFGGVILKWKPHASAKNKTHIPNSNSENTFEPFEENKQADEFEEFSSDSFETFSTTSNNVRLFDIQEVGLVFIEEFGSSFHTYKYYSGLFAEVILANFINLRAEVVDQYIPDYHTIAFWINLQKDLNWGKTGNTNLSITYLEKIDIDTDALFYPSFSNLFMGEVMRLDAIDLPLIKAAAQHRFLGKKHARIELNGLWQINNENTREYDLLFGLKPTKNIRLTTIFSYLDSEKLDSAYWMARLELRIAI